MSVIIPQSSITNRTNAEWEWPKPIAQYKEQTDHLFKNSKCPSIKHWVGLSQEINGNLAIIVIFVQVLQRNSETLLLPCIQLSASTF